MSSAEMMNVLKQRIALNNRALDYAKLVYGVKQTEAYPNSILIDNTVPDSTAGSYYIHPVYKTISNVSTLNVVDETILLENNLSKICSPSDSHTVATEAKLTNDITKTINQFFGQFLLSVSGVTFKSTDSLVKHIVTFCDKLDNNVNVKSVSVVPAVPAPAPAAAAPTAPTAPAAPAAVSAPAPTPYTYQCN